MFKIMAQRLASTGEIVQATQVWHNMALKMTLVPIPEANMASVGSTNYFDNPPHFVTLHPFYMSQTQVTQASYEAIMGVNPSRFRGDDYPVERVSWHDAVEFARQLSLLSDDISDEVKEDIRNLSTIEYMRYALARPEAGLFRLPTEAEWEFAARGQEKGSTENYPWGGSISDIGFYAQTSINNNLESTQPVGSLVTNGFGLEGMIGNVWEWTADAYDSTAFQEGELYNNNTAIAEEGLRVLRGGSWYCSRESSLQVAFRYFHNSDFKSVTVGIRLVRTMP